MDPILAEIYSTVLGSAPYVVAAYASMWLVLLVFVMRTFAGLKKTELRLAALEKQLGKNSLLLLGPDDQAGNDQADG